MFINNSIKNNHSGFIALLSTIIIGAVLLTMTVAAGQSGFYTRFMVLGQEAKEQSKLLAASCGKQTLAKLLHDLTFLGGATTTSLVGTCYVYPIEKETPAADMVSLRVRGVVRGSVTNLIFVVKVTDIYQGVVPLIGHSALGLVSEPELISVTEVATMP